MKLFLSIFIFTFYTILPAQNSSDADSLFERSADLLYQKSAESVKIAEFLFENIDGENDKMNASLILTESYLMRGDYKAAVENLFKSWKLAESTGNSTDKIKVNSLLMRICSRLEIDWNSIEFIQEEKNPVQSYHEKAIRSFSKSDWNQTIKWLKLYQEKQKDEPAEFADIFLALSYLNIGLTDSAQIFTDKIKNFEPYYSFL